MQVAISPVRAVIRWRNYLAMFIAGLSVPLGRILIRRAFEDAVESEIRRREIVKLQGTPPPELMQQSKKLERASGLLDTARSQNASLREQLNKALAEVQQLQGQNEKLLVELKDLRASKQNLLTEISEGEAVRKNLVARIDKMLYGPGPVRIEDPEGARAITAPLDEMCSWSITNDELRRVVVFRVDIEQRMFYACDGNPGEVARHAIRKLEAEIARSHVFRDKRVQSLFNRERRGS